MAIPLAYLAWTTQAVVHNAFTIPYDDQWENFWWWRRILEMGEIPKGYLFSQHNEHRILLPRLVFLADIRWFQGTNVLNMAAIGVIQLIAGALFVKAAGVRSLRWIGVLALAVALSLVWSATQWQNLFWGFQVSFLGVYAAGGWAIYLFGLATEHPGRPRWGLLAVALVALVAATFTMASGVFAGFAMVLIGLLARRGWKATAIAAATTLVLLAAYLNGYKTVPHPAPAADGLVQHYLVYVLAFLGNVWALGQLKVAVALGAAGAVLTAAMGVLTLRGARDPGRVAMLGITLFIGMSAGVTAFGRLGYGLEHALSSRYTTPACYFWAAQAIFWGLTAQGAGRIWWRLAASLPLIAALATLPAIQRHGLTPLYGVRERILLAASAIVGGLDDEVALKRAYPEAARVREFIPFLRSRGLSVFADDPGYRVGSQLPAERMAPEGACWGAFDILAPDRDGGATWQVLGWSWDQEQRRSLDRVILTDPSGRVTGVALGGLRRDDVPKVLKGVRTPRSGWTGVVEPAAGQQLTAWGVRRGGTLCKLGTLPPIAPVSAPTPPAGR